MRFPTIEDGQEYYTAYRLGCELLHLGQYWPAFRSGLAGLLIKPDAETVEGMYEIPFQAVARGARPASAETPSGTLLWEFWDPIRLARQKAVEGIRPCGPLPPHLEARIELWFPIWTIVKSSPGHWQEVVGSNPEGVFGSFEEVSHLLDTITHAKARRERSSTPTMPEESITPVSVLIVLALAILRPHDHAGGGLSERERRWHRRLWHPIAAAGRRAPRRRAAGHVAGLAGVRGSLNNHPFTNHA
jgi:hypothetical protein